MTKEDVIRMAQKAGFVWLGEYHSNLEDFAAFVASAERERIKQANAPEIERVNAHIKKLEDAVLAEREACAELCDSHWEKDGAALWCANAIRTRSNP